MSRIVYSTSLSSHLNNALGRKPFYRRPLPWLLLLLVNALLLYCFIGKVPLDALWRVLPQAKATQRSGSQISAEAERAGPALEAKLAVLAAPVDPRQARAASYIAKKYHIAHEAAEHIASEAFKAGKRHHVDPLIMLAVIGVESHYNPLAESSVGALGLTQALPEFHPDKVAQIERQEGHILNIADNIELGSRIFSEYSQRFKGDEMMALQQYNGSLDDPTRAYSRKVLELRAELKRSVG